METISKNFETIKQAERYQNKLYNKYNSVVLVHFPILSESGQYVWKVQF